MNFISKLIILVVILVVISVAFLSLKVIDLTNNYGKMNAKVEKINIDLNEKINNGSKPPEDTTPTEDIKEEYYGIDVSHWNGNIVSEIPSIDHISFVICKATQGITSIDSEFKENWTLIKEVNKIRGAYHFYMYNDDPIKQATHFCNVVNDLEKTDISLILDIEELSLPKSNVDRVKLKADIIKFLEYVENKIQRIPIVYTDYSFANQYLDDVKFSKYPLWLAEYTDKDPKIPNAWKKTGCMILQKSNDYNINSTKEDYDVFFGKKEELYK